MSENIEMFLKFLREAEQYLHIAEANEQEANGETQDILHALELGELNYHQRAKLADKLKEVRKKRRAAMDLLEEVTPIVEWKETYKDIVKSLERLLGEVRKIEKNRQTRIYTTRTKVLEDVISSELK